MSDLDLLGVMDKVADIFQKRADTFARLEKQLDPDGKYAAMLRDMQGPNPPRFETGE